MSAEAVEFAKALRNSKSSNVRAICAAYLKLVDDIETAKNKGAWQCKCEVFNDNETYTCTMHRAIRGMAL